MPDLPTNYDNNTVMQTTHPAAHNDVNTAVNLINSQIATGALVPDATTSSKGKIQLAGDLGGTAALPLTKSRTVTKTVGKTGMVADYICDGTADNVEIQAAVDAVIAAGGGTVSVRAGTYTFVTEVIVLGSNVIIRGEGTGTVFTLANEVNREVFVVGNGNANGDGPRDYLGIVVCNNVSFKDFAIDGNKSHQTAGSPAYTYGTRNLIRYRLDAQTSSGGSIDGVYVHNGKQNGFSNESGRDLTITGSSRSEDNDFFGVWIESGGRTTINSLFTRNNSGFGIKIFGGGMVNISGWESERDVGGGLAVQTTDRVSVIGNIIREAGYNASAKPAISLSGSSKVMILGNSIQAPYGDGIEITSSSTNNIISNNTLQDVGQLTTNTYSSIHFKTGSNTNNLIEGNTFLATTTNKPKYHLDDDNTNATDNTFSDNQFLATVGTAINGMASTSRFSPNFGLNPQLLLEDGGTSASTAVIARDNLNTASQTSTVVGPTGDNGYVTDGTADDVQIQAAMDAMNALPNGGIVELQSGTYNISTNIVPKNNVWFRGQGMFGQTKLMPVNNNYTVNFRGPYTRDAPLTNFQMTDMEIDCTLLDPSVYAKAVDGLDFTDCQFKRLYIHDSTATGLGIDYPRNSVIDSCLIKNCGFINKKTITAASWSGNTFTFTTSTPHGMVAPVKATGTLTASGAINDGDTVTLVDLVYTFKTVLTGASFEVAINGSTANALVNFQKAVNLTGVAGTDYGTGTEIHPTVTVSAVTATTASLSAKSFGSGGNAIITTETGANLSFGSGTLTGGISGYIVVITGMTPQQYNGNYAVTTVPTSTTFTISSSNNSGPPQSFNLTLDPGAATIFGYMATAGASSPFGYNGIGIGCNDNYDESLIVTNNVCINNMNNNYLIENDGVITIPNNSSSFIFGNNISFYAGQAGYRATGTPNGQFNNNYDFASHKGVHLAADIASKIITAASWSAGTATFTTSNDHNFPVGDKVGITGVIPNAWNGYYTIVSTPTTTTFTVAIVSDPGTFLHVGTASRLGRPVEGASVNNCILSQNLAYGIFTGSQSIGVLIESNTIKDCLNEGIHLTAGYTQIEGNRIFNCGRSGIQVSGSTNANSRKVDYIDIGNNIIYNNGKRVSSMNGVSTTSTAANPVQNMSFHDNHIFDNQDVKTQTFGIDFDGVVYDCSIADNDLIGNLTAPVDTDAGSTIAFSNNLGVDPSTPYDLGNITGTVTFNCATANYFSGVLTGNITAVMTSAPVEGMTMTWVLKQPDAGGPYTLTLPANVVTSGTLTLSTSAAAIDVITWVYRVGNTNKWVELSRSIHDLPANVKGPASSTDNALVRWDGTTGKIIQDSSSELSDSGSLGLGITPVSKAHIYQSTTDVSTATGLTIEQASTGDAEIQFLLTGVRRWVLGIDNSDSDKLKIAANSDLGATTLFAMTTAGVSTFTGNVGVPDEVYGSSWDGSTNVPTKNAVYDKIQTLLGSTAYTPTNVTTDRSYDANATTIDELADVLGTLIADLQSKGVLS